MNPTHLGQKQRSLADTRIIVLLPSLDLEDSGEQALQLTKHLRHTEWADVELWGLHSPGRVAQLCEQHGIPWRVVPFSWTGGLLGRIVTLCRFAYTLRRAHPAILVSYTMLPNVLCGLVWRWTGAQLCIWNQQDEGIERLDPTAEKWAVQRTPILVSNSRAGADFLVHSLGAAPKHIRVIQNGVELARPQYSRLEWRDRVNLKENAFVACTVATLSQNKDHATLLRAWRLVVDRLAIHGQDAVLLLAGRPNAALDFPRALCSRLGLTTNVKFLGVVDDVPGLLQAADLAVFSSFSESSPNGVLECMAAGLAVAGSDIPGIREALGEEASALLAAPGDASGLADRITALALNRELRTGIGNLNQRRALANFDPREMCQEMVSVMASPTFPLSGFGYQLRDVGLVSWALSRAFLKHSLVRVFRCARRQARALLGPHASRRLASLGERALTYSPLTAKLAKEVRPKFKIGMAVLAHERPGYLELCLESLFSTKLYDYDITFLLHDDGSKDPRVREILDRHRDPEYNIARHYVSAAHGSAGGAINSATRRLFEIDTFSIIGWCDSDTLFHPEWLHQMMKICLWAKKNHKDHVLGPFSCFNSSDFVFHKILNTHSSPYGNYVVKRQMGMLVYFWFTKDLEKVGPFPENRDDETLMTARLARSRIRNFCTETSFAEHIGHVSVLNQWRPSPVLNPVHAMNMPRDGWPQDLQKADTLGYYRYVKANTSFGENVESRTPINVIIPVVEKDLDVLPYVIDGARANIRHPIARITVIAPESKKIKAVCAAKHCEFVYEGSVSPIAKEDINYVAEGRDRSGWLFQQFLKWSGDSVATQEHFLFLDADTVLLRPQVFVVDDKSVLLHSDEHHQPYFDVYKRLFGEEAPTPLSFVSHHMLYTRTRLAELKKQIEKMHENEAWHRVLLRLADRSSASGISEYEIYGQWMLANHASEIIREYWFNIALDRECLPQLSLLRSELAKEYRSVSFHEDT